MTPFLLVGCAVAFAVGGREWALHEVALGYNDSAWLIMAVTIIFATLLTWGALVTGGAL